MNKIVSEKFFRDNGFQEISSGFYKSPIKTEDVGLIVNQYGHVWVDYVCPEDYNDSNAAIGIGIYTEEKLRLLVELLKNCK